jgi:hypothetical protein
MLLLVLVMQLAQVQLLMLLEHTSASISVQRQA